MVREGPLHHEARRVGDTDQEAQPPAEADVVRLVDLVLRDPAADQLEDPGREQVEHQVAAERVEGHHAAHIAETRHDERENPDQDIDEQRAVRKDLPQSRREVRLLLNRLHWAWLNLVELSEQVLEGKW